MNNLSKIAFLSVVALSAGCVNRPPKNDYSQFRTEGPRSILVVPVINKSIDVNAPDYFLATIARPLEIAIVTIDGRITRAARVRGAVARYGNDQQING